MGNKPVGKWQAGGVEVCAWASDRGGYTFTFSKRYKKGTEWQESKTLFVGDLVVASALLAQAFRFGISEPARHGGAQHAYRPPVPDDQGHAQCPDEEVPF